MSVHIICRQNNTWLARKLKKSCLLARYNASQNNDCPKKDTNSTTWSSCRIKPMTCNICTTCFIHNMALSVNEIVKCIVSHTGPHDSTCFRFRSPQLNINLSCKTTWCVCLLPSYAGTESADPRRLDLSEWLHTKVLYLSGNDYKSVY